tara:strand:- start:23 stop:232 length:210 start_codon:yes stop_codon:yes gene_type:complete
MSDDDLKRIGELMVQITNSGKFIEMVNDPEYPGWELSGYSGYNAARLSEIEKEEFCIELKLLLDKKDID